MVFPNQLVEALAEVLGVPVQTVSQHDRMLALSGHRKSGGRGRSAARLTPTDAANLIIAVVGAPVSGPTVRDSAKNFERYAWLPANANSTIRQPARWAPEVKILHELQYGHAFRDALAALISVFSGPKQMMSPDVFRQADEDPFKNVSEVQVVVKLLGPEPEASITLLADCPQLKPGRMGLSADDFTPDRITHELFYAQSLDHLFDQPDFAHIQLKRSGDLYQTRTITEVTIHAIAKLFSDQQTAKK